MRQWLTVVGIGEDGLSALGDAARQAVASAQVLVGGRRHLALVPESAGQERLAWPSPFDQAVDLLLARRGTSVCVLASGDPMWFGIGASLAQRLAAEEWVVHPAPSAFSLAAARLGWPLQDVVTLSLCGRPPELLHRHLQHRARLLVLCRDGGTPAEVAALLVGRGFGDSRLTALEHMGGPAERRVETTAGAWPPDRSADLCLLAVDCRGAGLSGLAGLPDEAFRHDGQLTKRVVRAAALSCLAPAPGELLWDVGAGCGSIGIEWMRTHVACRAIAVEAAAERCAVIADNARTLGVPGLQVLAGRAPAMLEGLPTPDAIFIGGGVTATGVLDRCWAALPAGGRLVASAVTLQSEALLTEWRSRTGGELTRIAVSQATPLGRFETWRPALPVTLLAALKPAA